MTLSEQDVPSRLEEMKRLRNGDDHAAARAIGDELAAQLAKDSPYAEALACERALATYKDPELPRRRALSDAESLLAPFVSDTKSPETLGVAGAIAKRYYEVDLRIEHLLRSISCYRLGHDRDRESDWSMDGYPGINAAFVLDLLAAIEVNQGTGDGSDYRRIAKELREEIVCALEPRVKDPGGSPGYWALVTYAEAKLGVDAFHDAEEQLERAGELDKTPGWQRETTGRQLAWLLRLRHTDKNEKARKALRALLHDTTDAVQSAFRGRVGLALSGGGFRASFFHIGLLARLAELGLLRRVEVLSCVSGGSLVGALYYLELQALYEEKADTEIGDADFVGIVDRMATAFVEAVAQNIRWRVLSSFCDNVKMLEGSLSRTMKAGRLYEEHLYSRVGKKPRKCRRYMDDLLFRSREKREPLRLRHHNWERNNKYPTVVFNATNLNTGHAWHFTAESMGEPPFVDGDAVDANDRFVRAPYEAFSHSVGSIRLGTAVGASACVPGIFEPIELAGVYPGVTLRLVDGGVYDNQGSAALLDFDCDTVIVSDASGQMSQTDQMAGDLLSVVSRTNSVLQARVRDAMYEQLRAREQGKLLRDVVFLHLKQDLAPGVVSPSSDAVVHDGSELTPYGFSRDVQERLAALRTDLDSFSELEAKLLMANGYAMAKAHIKPGALELEVKTVADHGKFGFKRALELARATRKNGEKRDLRVLESLEAGQHVVGKAWRVSLPLRILTWIAGLALVTAAVLCMHRWWNARITGLTVGAAVMAIATMLVGRRIPFARPWLEVLQHKIPFLDTVRIWALALGLSTAAFLALTIGDRIYFSAGRIQRFL